MYFISHINFIRSSFSSTDLNALRTLAAQTIVGGLENQGMQHFRNYVNLFNERFTIIIQNITKRSHVSQNDSLFLPPSTTNTTWINPEISADMNVTYIKSLPSEDLSDDMLSFLLSECQGKMKLLPRVTDSLFLVSDMIEFDATFR